MQTRSSQGSVLGKRAHHLDLKAVPSASTTDIANMPQQILTPEQSPKSKRARISLSAVDGDSNKENVPPFRVDVLGDTTVDTPRSLRSVTRTSTEIISSSRTRPVRRHSSTSSVPTIPSTPAASLSSLVISTPPPTPPVLLLPVYTRARGLLRSISTSSSPIACREDERQRIMEFITSSWFNDAHTSLYISGTPGTGKTALVNSVLRSLEQSEETSDLRVISINCMALRSVDALWDRLYEELCRARVPKCTKPCKAKGKQAVEKALSTVIDKCVLVLDELDHIASSNQTLASIFSLSEHYPSTLRVIGIANTHTLTSSLALVSSRGASSALTLHFASYSSQQLLQVLQARLSSLYDTSEFPEAAEQANRFLPTATLTLLTKKIASQTGDVRALFEVLRGAIDLAVTGSKVPVADANPLATPLPIVRPDHILAALKAYLPSASTAHSSSALTLSLTSSETVSKVRNLGLQVRLALLCTLLASKRTATLFVSGSTSSTPTTSPMMRANSTVSQRTAGLDIAQLHTYYSSVLTRGDNDIFTPVSRSEFSDLVGMLETVGLVSSGSAGSATSSPSKTGRRALGRAASFGVMKGAAAGQHIKLTETIRADEVLRGLGVTDGSSDGDVREEEVRAIWARECGRIARESKAKSMAGTSVDKPFEEAFED